jgi:hypothetical protein
MQNDIEIKKKLKEWLSSYYFKKSTLLIKEEVQFKVEDFRMIADIILIQSKSNVIHGFEIKTTLTQGNLNSALWQTYSYYTNYRWLVTLVGNVNELNESTLLQFNKLGLGLITFNKNNQSFKVLKEAKYVDGNFLKFIPELENEWQTINKSK